LIRVAKLHKTRVFPAKLITQLELCYVAQTDAVPAFKRFISFGSAQRLGYSLAAARRSSLRLGEIGMKTRTVLLIALVGTGMFLCEFAEAQFIGRRAFVGGVRNWGGRRWYGSGYPTYGGYYNMPAQTAYSSALREQSQVIAAQGIATKNRAQASLVYEQAREQYIANSKQWNAVLAERRRAKAALDAQKKADQAVRAEKNRQRPKPVRQPTPRLTSSQLDHATGKITWPEDFMGEEFAKDRREVESVLKVMAQGAASAPTMEALSDATSRMRKIVGTNAREYGFQKYAAMKKFLVSLAAEGTNAAGEVPVLVQQVGSDSSDKHFDAIMKLGTMGPKAAAAVPALTKALSSDDPVIQNQAIITLGEIGLAANSAESAVAQFLENDSPILQHSAIESLRKMGATSAGAIGRLRVLAKNDEPLTSVAAVWALAVLDPNSEATVLESIPRLIEALGNKEAHIRNDASIALAGIGSPAVEPLLAALEKGDGQVQLQVCDALQMIGPPAKPAVPALVGLLGNEDQQLARRAALALGNIGAEAEAGVPGIIRLLDHREPGVRTDAALALAGIGAGSKLAVTSLTELLKDKDSGVRMAAATALGNIGSDAGAASDALVATLGDSVGGVTISAAGALAQIGTPAVSAVV
jgi:HEAT repeat protein